MTPTTHLSPRRSSSTSHLCVSIPFADNPPSLRTSAPPARSQLKIDLDSEQWDDGVKPFETTEEMCLYFTSVDNHVSLVVSKMWTVLSFFAEVAGPLGLRRLFVYLDAPVVLSKQVRLSLCRRLGHFLTAVHSISKSSSTSS